MSAALRIHEGESEIARPWRVADRSKQVVVRSSSRDRGIRELAGRPVTVAPGVRQLSGGQPASTPRPRGIRVTDRKWELVEGCPPFELERDRYRSGRGDRGGVASGEG